jgi:hypothetical protein
MPAFVENSVSYSVYRKLGSSDYCKPDIRTITNRNRPQTRRIAELARSLTMLTTILIGLLLTRSRLCTTTQRRGWRRHLVPAHATGATPRTAC